MKLTDVASLPEILCGPILRRVDTHHVSVWVALKQEAWVELKLYDETLTFDPGNIDDPGFVDNPITRPGFTHERVATHRLGEHLFVALATLTIDAGETGLVPGQKYGYNLFFHDDATAGSNFSLARSSLKLLTLSNHHRIGFEHGHLPGFVVPPTAITALKILHGSCRKPHGEGIDMLASLDTLFTVDNAHASAASRPHMLLLTGDQIYADDVSPPLLRMLHETAKTLLGWHETLWETAPHESIADAMANLKDTVDQLADALDNDPASLTQQVIDGLADDIDEAAGDVGFVFPDVTSLLAVVSISGQLGDYASQLRALPPLAATTADLIAGIQRFLTTYTDLFEPLSTERSWGSVAVVELDEDVLVLDGVRNKLTAVATSAATDSSQLLSELELALEDDFEGPELQLTMQQLRADVATLGTTTALTVERITVLAQALLDFYNSEVVDTYQPSRIAPPQRGFELKQFAKLTSGAMSAHLMFLGEFYMMYLFAWSDVLWPHREHYPLHNEAVPNYALFGPMSTRGLGQANDDLAKFAAGLPAVRRVLANVPTMMIFDDHEVTDDWNLNEDWVLSVNDSEAGAQFLRNAMVAYAIFQDWGNQPDDYGTIVDADGELPLGRQLLDAVTYDGADPPPMLREDDAAVASVNAILGLGTNAAGELPGLTLDSVIPPHLDLVDLVDYESEYSLIDPVGRKRWDWQYDIGDANTRRLRLISLDTRTHRGFPTEAWGVRLELDYAIKGRAGGKTAGATLIHPAELKTQLVDRLESEWLHIVISPAPVFGLPLLEDLAQRMSVLNSSPEVADFESWQANPAGLGELVAALRNADCVLLSGDVHYAYSNRLSFPEADPDPDGIANNLLVQLCSSSMKNETAGTQALAAIGRDGRLTHFVWPLIDEIREIITKMLADFGQHLREDLASADTWWNETAPLVSFFSPDAWMTYYLMAKDAMVFAIEAPSPIGLLAVGEGVVTYITDPSFRGVDGTYERPGFTMHFDKDLRGATERRDRAAALTGLDEAAISAGMYRTDERLAEMSEIVGYNNAARLTFTGLGEQPGEVQHELFWHPHGDDNEPLPLVGSGSPGQLVLASTHHGETTDAASLIDRIVTVAHREIDAWSSPGRIYEDTPAGETMLKAYKATFMGNDAERPYIRRFEYSHFPKPDGTASAWSALFVSFVLSTSQAGPSFLYSPRHIDYIRQSWADRQNDTGRFHYFLKAEQAVQVGDIVCGNSGQTLTMAEIAVDPPDQGGNLSVHCDIVIAIDTSQTPHRALVAGGNVHAVGGREGTNTAAIRTRDLDDEGRLDVNGLHGLIRVVEP